VGGRLLNFGDLPVEIEGRGIILLKRIPRPNTVKGLLTSAAADARRDYQRVNGPSSDGVQAALTRIFNGRLNPNNTPTVEIERITRLTLRAQRRTSLLPDEAILYVTRRHLTQPLSRSLIPLLIGAAGISGAIALHLQITPATVVLSATILTIWVVWILLDWASSALVLTSNRILAIRRSVFVTHQRDAAQLRSVRDAVLHFQRVTGRMLNKGAIVLELHHAEPVKLTAVPRPDRFHRLISDAVEAAIEHDRLREQEQLAGTLTGWFEEYHKMQSSP
jgi:hypothetical protein